MQLEQMILGGSSVYYYTSVCQRDHLIDEVWIKTTM